MGRPELLNSWTWIDFEMQKGLVGLNWWPNWNYRCKILLTAKQTKSCHIGSLLQPRLKHLQKFSLSDAEYSAAAKMKNMIWWSKWQRGPQTNRRRRSTSYSKRHRGTPSHPVQQHLRNFGNGGKQCECECELGFVCCWRFSLDYGSYAALVDFLLQEHVKNMMAKTTRNAPQNPSPTRKPAKITNVMYVM